MYVVCSTHNRERTTNIAKGLFFCRQATAAGTVADARIMRAGLLLLIGRVPMRRPRS